MKSSNPRSIFIFIGTALVIAGTIIANRASAATVVASNDADIRGPNVGTDGTSFSVGDWAGSPASLDRNTVISFDLSTYTSDPNFVEFTSVLLRLGVPVSGNPGSALNHEVRRLLRDFDETTVDYAEYSPGNAWDAPGALGANDATSIATGVNSGSTSGAAWAGGGLDVTAAANAWVGAGDTIELGFLIRPEDKFQILAYGSAESTDGPGPGPVLEVEANLIPNIITSTNVTVADTLGVSFNSVLNETFVLQSTPDLVSSNFSDTGAFAVGIGGGMTLFDPTGPSTSKNYRVLQE